LTVWIAAASLILSCLGAKSVGAGKTPVAHEPQAARPVRTYDGNASADQACTKDLARGDVASARARCADLKPATAPESVYWRMVLADDPNDLRKGLNAVALQNVAAEPRLLLLAGRYQFSRGELRELQDLVHLAARLKLKGPRIDTLRRLSEGK